ncbi:AbiJ-NTD4 domain-containing protein [uncultured Thiothrix sp.]|jgi:hypothetical protein|uniref:AbiJ-NTD4 domain-containing protein n=1 Tax=uncultured Thiothrix sp. TaxID=223185 RepID=UPI00263826D1|nr:hypothetical protein [uncultured Thiothrix sp.]HMT92319.1 hypothetical protein [Thiolinea sp.]
MTFEYFSDRENGKTENTIEVISESVWNGIVSVYKKLIHNNNLSYNFPYQCNDGLGIYACNEKALEHSIKAEIPNLLIPIQEFQYYSDKYPDTYDVLDFLEFLYKNITDVTQNNYHSFFKHYHLSFHENGLSKKQFIENINLLLNRNRIIFYLDINGKIQRTIPSSLKIIVDGIRQKSEDHRLNELFEMAYSKIILPRPLQRLEGLERLWDCFERLKTYYNEINKKKSAEALIDHICGNNILFKKYMNSEFTTLTEIGNNFQIRHFERDKTQITENHHIDYLFYRMSCLINLCLNKINKS